MRKEPVIVVLDLGRTNKKIVVFDNAYNMIFEESTVLSEKTDEDGFVCEDIILLTEWVAQAFSGVIASNFFDVRAVNFSAYGASLVHVNEFYRPCTELYSYLKPYPQPLSDQFYAEYGDRERLCLETASPPLGNLNAGLQLYRLKYQQPRVYNTIRFSLHLPQYISSIITQKLVTEITSIGTHTHLWNFKRNDYHDWVRKEEMISRFPPLVNSRRSYRIKIKSGVVDAGVGVHDSSAALLPYLYNRGGQFVLLSTGTWFITFNPFNQSPLTAAELDHDCLFYLTPGAVPVKASRLFAGRFHDEQHDLLCSFFAKNQNDCHNIRFDRNLYDTINIDRRCHADQHRMLEKIFTPGNLEERCAGRSYEACYHQLVVHIVEVVAGAVKLVLGGDNVHRLIVNGGFSKSDVFMHVLAHTFPAMEVYAGDNPQGSAIGAALLLHRKWNFGPLPASLLSLKQFSTSSC